MYRQEDFIVPRLGKCSVPSPLNLSKEKGDGVYNYTEDDERILMRSSLYHFNICKETNTVPESFEKGGPKEFLYFDPAKTKVAIVTCGGLCPGLNNVIRGLVMQLYNRYGVTRIVGIKYGYEGFIPKYKHDIIELTPDLVENIHTNGGTILGTSRGHQDVGDIVDALERMNINILFTIGGDGALRGALAITEEVQKRGLKISIAGIPKTIDNDINLIEKSFGFETAFTIATDILRGAHNEAKGAYNGIALVKLMGRDSGFIASNAALAVQEVNYVLIPEVKFDLEGPKGFLKVLRNRLERKHHALIVVAEGAGQDLLEKSSAVDASGNKKLNDIGLFLKDAISAYFKAQNMEMNMKYIDPSYIIRSLPPTPADSIYCNRLGTNAVHAAMAGRTKMLISMIHNAYVHVPMELAVSKRNSVDPEGPLWRDVLIATGQPGLMKN
jgi:6-phosphofructokinase 1